MSLVQVQSGELRNLTHSLKSKFQGVSIIGLPLILAMGQALFSLAATLHCLHMERLMTKECLNHQLAVLKGCSPEILCYLITLHYLELAIIFLIV